MIETKRLILRKFESSDLPFFEELAADPEVMRFSLKGPMSKELAKEYFEQRVLLHYQKHGYGLLAAFLKETHEFIGFIGLISQTIDGIDEVELAYRLLPRYWGQGFATEAALAICEYAFQTMGVQRLISLIDLENKKSLQVALRVGMHFWKSALFHNNSVQVYAKTR